MYVVKSKMFLGVICVGDFTAELLRLLVSNGILFVRHSETHQLL